MAVETSSAAFILVATVAALVVANTPLVGAYEHFWETTLTLEVGGLHVLHVTLHELVNDALMTLFFLLVSLEIKREMVFGELRDPRAAALPIVAAVGGMVVPALIYVAFNLARHLTRTGARSRLSMADHVAHQNNRWRQRPTRAR